MDFESLERVAPDYADDLSDRMDDLLCEVDMSRVPDLGRGIVKHLQAKIGTTPPDLAARATGYYHPSALAMDPFCPFDVMQSRMSIPGTYQKDPAGAIRLDIGSGMHEIVQKYLFELYGATGLAEETLVYEPLHLKGHCDFILKLNGFEAIVEIKTKDTTAGLTKPVPWHVRQCHIYQFIRKAPVGIVLYIDMTTKALISFPHTFRFNVWQEVVDRAVSMEAARLDGRMARPAPNRWCPNCSSNQVCPSYQSRTTRFLEVDDG